MHKLLQKWLDKSGVNSPEELDNTPMPDGSPTERQTFEEYRAVLAKKELTLEDIKTYCLGQVGVIEGKWADYDTPNTKKAELIPYHTVYRTLVAIIDSPISARATLEQQLEELTK